MVVGSGRLARGYWNDADATAAAFLPHPTDPSRQIYRTGDVVRLGDDGLLHFVGRTDNQVKLHGWRIELEEFEAAVRSFAGVAAAGVVPRRDQGGKVQALALHVASSGDVVDGKALRTHLGRSLPRHMVPAVITVGRVLPQTATGKVDRPRLAELDA